MKINNISLLIVILAVFFLAVFINKGFSMAVPPKMNLVPSDYSSGITWEKAKKINKPIVVEFYVDWCHYCKEFAPILNKATIDYGSKYTFLLINCDDPKNQSLVNEFNIDSYPSLFLVDLKKNRRVQVDSSAFQSLKSLEQQLDSFLK